MDGMFCWPESKYVNTGLFRKVNTKWAIIKLTQNEVSLW